ncbi:insulinase family protein [Lujinxingia litoralis]|uniref:Insulinase family protein n=1 Tax=Lujinxingia litoralis TaxID=2211119 RepID=A0A328C6L1_9DELT|nr:pitrilysin family protein [Lujinxingia litoralis]RAL22198.1 insulinase family protein [Lujinxingia litoralis]
MEFTRYTLDNGLTVILQPTTTAPVVACNVWVGVGSADEEPFEAGLAHVHEHMLFKGTERRGVGELAREIESAGGHINAFTSFDQTCYYVVMSSRFFETGLDILSDAIRHSSFDAEELTRELEVIQEEIKRGEDNPSRMATQQLFETAYRTHPYRLPVIGTSESVDSFDRPAVHAFFKKHYVPSNMAVILAGDFELDEARTLVERYFGDFAGADYQAVQRPAEPPQTRVRASVSQRDIQQNHLRLAFHIPDACHEDMPALDVLSIILGYGDAAHLHRVIEREEELVNAIYASAYSPREAGLFFIGADFQRDPQRPETAPDHVLRRVLEETYRFAEIAPNHLDVERARTLLESQAVYGKQTIEGLAMKIGHYQMVAGDPAFEQTYYRQLRQVSPADVQRVARAYLRLDNTSIALLSPAGEEAPGEEELIAQAQRAFEQVQVEAVDAGVSTAPEDDFVRVEIPDGPTLIVQVDRSVETFSMRALTLGGLRYETPQTVGLNQILAELMTEGTEQRSSLALAREVESMAASIGGIAGRNSFGLGMTGLTRFFDQCFDVFADVLTGATLPEEEFERVRKLQLQKLRARHDQPGAVNYELFARTFFGEHPYAYPILGTEESLQALTPQMLRDYLAQRRNPAEMVLSVVGDVDVEATIAQVERYFVRPRAASMAMPAIAPAPTFSESLLVTQALDKEQAHITAGFAAPLLGSAEADALELIDAVLSGQGGRLFYELRDRQSLAYSVYASAIVGLDASAFTVRIGTSPEKIAQAVGGIRQQIERLHSEPPTADEIARAKRYLIGNHDIGLQRNNARAMTFGLDELYRLGYQRSLGYGDRISALSARDLQQVIDTYLNPDTMVVAITHPSQTPVSPDLLKR